MEGKDAHQLQAAMGHACRTGNHKKQLRELSGISTASLAKLGKGENLTTDTLLKICKALNCSITEIMETVPDVRQDESICEE